MTRHFVYISAFWRFFEQCCIKGVALRKNNLECLLRKDEVFEIFDYILNRLFHLPSDVNNESADILKQYFTYFDYKAPTALVRGGDKTY